MRFLTAIFFLFFSLSGLKAQHVIEYPEVAEQSHQELNISKIILYHDSTVVYLTVENKLEQGGWFCADKNITLESGAGQLKRKLVRSRGIPNCPSSHQFKSVGEKLNFTLVFGPIPAELKVISLIENCREACFRFQDIILDDKLNRDIKLSHQAEGFMDKGKYSEALEIFKKVIEKIPEKPTHVYGFAFYNLVKGYTLLGDKKSAKTWYYKFSSSDLPDRFEFLDKLQKEGIHF